MLGWGAVAGTVLATEWLLKLSGRPLLSHSCWAAYETRRGAAVVAAGTGAVAWHLNVPHRRWADALRFGLACGAAVWLTTKERQ